MAILENLIKHPGKPGLFYRVHSTRKHGVNKDRQWVIRQTLGKQTRISVLKWQSEGMKEGDAFNEVDKFASNYKWNRQNPTKPSKPLCIADEQALADKENEDNPPFEIFAERFTANHVNTKLRESTAKEYRRQINKILIPAWKERKLIDIQRKHIVKLVEGIAKKTPIQANRTLATIKKLFSYALDVGVVPLNPATGIKPPGKEQIKDRVLTLNELATVFKVLEAQDSRDTSDILRLIALTGQRPGEVAEMRVSQLKDEADGTWWTKAGVDTKNKVAHRVYLSEPALKIVQDRIRDYGLDNYVFPARKKDGSISHMRKDVTVSRTRKVMPLFEGIEKFTAHDLRRSAATGIAMLGFGGVVPDILNHKPQGITRQVYDKYSRAPEIKRALISWGEAIERAISGKQADIISINQ